VQRLAQDHALATQLATALQGISGVNVEAPQTNIVFADLDPSLGNGLLAHLKARGVLATGLYRLRFVTHLDVDATGIEQTAATVRDYCLKTKV
jgi:threonine aldolase